MGPLGLPALQGLASFYFEYSVAPGKVFRFFLIRRCDCVGVGFPFLSSLIGSEKSRHSPIRCETKTNPNLVVRVFPALQAVCLFSI